MSDCSGYAGDGFCDSACNVASADWDGGDCCAETCECVGSRCSDNPCSEPEKYACKGRFLFFLVCLSRALELHKDIFDRDALWLSPRHVCADVSHLCALVPDSTNGVFDCPPSAGDSLCDNFCNTAAEDWDGGDCCEDTCHSSFVFSCDATASTCLQPGSCLSLAHHSLAPSFFVSLTVSV